MNHIDWQFVCFVGGSLVHEAWQLLGLPQVQYWEFKNTSLSDKTK
ncbi:hypothetical protein [Bacillus pinisoli]|nr:hypothetical protein [Bacillus pinisoli]